MLPEVQRGALAALLDAHLRAHGLLLVPDSLDVAVHADDDDTWRVAAIFKVRPDAS